VPRADDTLPNIPDLPCDNKIAMTINITVDQLLDIEDALVSEDHPTRDDGTFDYERCA
jgi:hypothetical protein